MYSMVSSDLCLGLDLPQMHRVIYTPQILTAEIKIIKYLSNIVHLFYVYTSMPYLYWIYLTNITFLLENIFWLLSSYTNTTQASYWDLYMPILHVCKMEELNCKCTEHIYEVLCNKSVSSQLEENNTSFCLCL